MKVSYGIGIALLGIAGTASAQSERRVDISVSNRLTYDTNALRATNALANTSTRKGDDFITSPALNVDVLLPVSRQSIYLNGSVGYDFYASNTQFNRERIGLAGGLNLAAGGGCGGVVGGEYSRGEDNLLDYIDGFDPGNVNEQRSYLVRANCSQDIGISSSVGYRHTDSENSSILRRRSNYRSDTIDVSIGYARPTLGVLSVYGDYTNTTYPHRQTLGPSPADDGVEVFGIGLRLERRIGRLLGGSFSAGYTKVRPKLAGVPSFSGPSYSADLTITPGSRTRMTVGVGRRVDQSNLLEISYSITDNLHFSADYSLTDALTLQGGASYVNRRLRQSPLALPGFAALRNDKNYRVFGGLRYAAARHWSLGSELSYNKRSAGNSLFDYDSAQASLWVSYAF
ncbi:MAG: hypothetical protein ABS87_11950 [Sphingomonas sp. SCN 67-18]|uniref:outer membrane beta-barrel protein n=1 Tax=uncultured Sphingomonas sp. TaxID=158754 RepID=UPI00086CB0EB|nr:outer membrane beta-barrel protein [Sphingomonas sp. SCN 67-18]ODU20119.1 MAG: hypothetical protein ABS87_11950 [Sphingomonas sp. SCN 67-18]